MRFSLAAIVGVLMFLAVSPAVPAGDQPPLPLDRLPAIITGTPDHRAEFREERRLMLLYEPRLSRTCLEALAQMLVEAGKLQPHAVPTAVAATTARLRNHFGKRLAGQRG